MGSVIILTYGEDFVQTPRVSKSGLRAAVADVIVTQKSKADTLEKYLQDKNIGPAEKIALVDDSLEHLIGVKARFPQAITIHLVRSSDTTTPPEFYRTASLAEAFSVLQKRAKTCAE
ncbi:MAG: hypothetical protein AAB421_03865 [Patescibacteria group bacterium]